MSAIKYSLQIISRLPEFNGKRFASFNVNGDNHIGVFNNEPFSIVFKNHSSRRVQVRLAIDGTDIITGEKATTAASGKMFIVGAYDTMQLDAWPETNEKGARFVFGDAASGVAAHTHGDISNKGIIAAAVFVDGIFNDYDVYSGGVLRDIGEGPKHIKGSPRRSTMKNSSEIYSPHSPHSSFDSSDLTKGCVPCAAGPVSSSDVSLNIDMERSDVTTTSAASAAVGAGETISQNLRYVAGFKSPLFTESLSIRYEYWNELKQKIEKYGLEQKNHTPVGFFKSSEEPVTNIDLGSTPRVLTTAKEKELQRLI